MTKALTAAPPCPIIDESLKSKDSLSHVPARNRMRAEITRKQREIKRLLARTQRKESQVMEMQERLNEILVEKNRREKELLTVSKLLPSSEDILALKKRLQKARDMSKKSTKKINDAEAHLFFSSSINNGRKFIDERRRQEEHVKLKHSLTSLKNEVARLRVQLQEVTNDACKDASSSHGEESTPGPACCNGPARLAKLLRQKKEYEARVDEATAAWRVATKREAKVTRLLHSLEKRIVPVLRVPERQKKNEKMENKLTLKNEDDDDLSFLHMEVGTLLATSMSHTLENAGSFGSLSFCSGHSHQMSPSNKTHSPRRKSIGG